mgnify:CR=1 FL=1
MMQKIRTMFAYMVTKSCFAWNQKEQGLKEFRSFKGDKVQPFFEPSSSIQSVRMVSGCEALGLSYSGARGTTGVTVA